MGRASKSAEGVFKRAIRYGNKRSTSDFLKKEISSKMLSTNIKDRKIARSNHSNLLMNSFIR